MQASVDESLQSRWQSILSRARAAADGRAVTVLAVSKTQDAERVRALATLGQHAFGENYVQEALGKQASLSTLDLEWHLIGALQSNKCAEVARHFDWLQTLDRAKLVPLLGKARPPTAAPLNVLIQVNIDDEQSKSGCTPEAIDALADAIAAEPRLRLRGLMAIPAPLADLDLRRRAFERMAELHAKLQSRHAGIDTLSMGMSEDFELAIRAGATLVRVGSLLFGSRPAK